MKNFEYGPFGTSSIIVPFKCASCGNAIECELSVPQPNYAADTAHDSTNEEEDSVICDECEAQYDITIYASYAGGDGQITGLSPDYEIDVEEVPEPYYEEQFDAISSNTSFFSTFTSELDNLRALNQIQLPNPATDKTLRRGEYTGAFENELRLQG